MGLDIIAFRKIHGVLDEDMELDEYQEPVDEENFVGLGATAKWQEETFPGRGDKLVDAPYNYYTFEDETSMRAGSYWGYHLWKSELKEFSDYLTAGELPVSVSHHLPYECPACGYADEPMEETDHGTLQCFDCDLEFLSGGWDYPGAFNEMIYFYDCEGVIGPETCKKLYNDFADNRFLVEGWAQVYIQDPETAAWFVEKYDQWTEMYEYGADEGAVLFC